VRTSPIEKQRVHCRRVVRTYRFPDQPNWEDAPHVLQPNQNFRAISEVVVRHTLQDDVEEQ
jgi:hypothetical protein